MRGSRRWRRSRRSTGRVRRSVRADLEDELASLVRRSRPPTSGSGGATADRGVGHGGLHPERAPAARAARRRGACPSPGSGHRHRAGGVAGRARDARSRRAQATDAPGWLELGASDGDTPREELFAAFGFDAAAVLPRDAPAARRGSCRRPRTSPRRCEIVPFDFAYDDATRAAHNEAFRDHFAANELDEETWSWWVTGDHGFRADCSYLVLDGDEIAGYVLNSVHPDDWPALGFSEGWTHQLGVRRPWRGRGVATALLDRERGRVRGRRSRLRRARRRRREPDRRARAVRVGRATAAARPASRGRSPSTEAPSPGHRSDRSG